MKKYPSISHEITKNKIVRVYEKLDGSNIRAEWSRNRGFYKFGTRNQLLSPSDPILGPAIQMIKAMEPSFAEWFNKVARSERGICYFEFWGENSFAGSHQPGDKMICSLLDVDLYKRGFIMQEEYDYFLLREEFNTPKLILEDYCNGAVEDAVRKGEIGSFEGVVCKGIMKNTKQNKPLMFKIKSKAWIDKLKETYKNNPKKIEELL